MAKGPIVKDEGTYYLRQRQRTHWRTGEVMPTKQRVNRYLCIGGPVAGAYRSGEELVDENLWDVYSSYNRGGGRGNGHTMVFIHTDLLP